MLIPQTIADLRGDFPLQDYPLDLQGYNPVTPFLTDLVRELQPRKILEVGTWLGYSADVWLSTARDADLYCVDTWLGALEFYTEPMSIRDLRPRYGYPSVYNQFFANMLHQGHSHNVYPVTMPSSLAYKYFRALDISFDFVYIDASHEYEDVLADLQNYTPLAKVIAGDDYDWPGVKQAVDEFLAPSYIAATCMDVWEQRGAPYDLHTNGREWYLIPKG